MNDYELQQSFSERDFLEQKRRLDSLKDSELRALNFPTKKNVLRDFSEKNGLPRFREIEESDNGALIARSGNSDDVFRIWATNYNPPLYDVDLDSNLIFSQSSVLYTGQGKSSWLDAERNPLIAKITLFSYAERTKRKGFNLPLFLEKNKFKKQDNLSHSRVIKRLDHNSEIYFLTKDMHKTELGDTPLTSLYID